MYVCMCVCMYVCMYVHELRMLQALYEHEFVNEFRPSLDISHIYYRLQATVDSRK